MAKYQELSSKDSEETSNPFDEEDQASSSEATSDGEMRSREVEGKVNGWWDMLDLEEYNEIESESDDESDCYLYEDPVEPLEMV